MNTELAAYDGLADRSGNSSTRTVTMRLGRRRRAIARRTASHNIRKIFVMRGPLKKRCHVASPDVAEEELARFTLLLEEELHL